MGGVIIFAVVLLVGVLVAVELLKREQRYRKILGDVEASPGDWLSVLTAHPYPKRPTGPELFRLGPQENALDEKVIAFDDQFIAIRSLGRGGHCKVLDRSWPPARYQAAGLFKTEKLFVGGQEVIGRSLKVVCSQLVRLGWPVLDAPTAVGQTRVTPGSWPRPMAPPPSGQGQGPATQRPGLGHVRIVPQVTTGLVSTPRGHIPGTQRWSPTPAGVVRPSASPRTTTGTPSTGPVPPAFVGQRPNPDRVAPAASEIEYGTEHLGAAIEDWLSDDDLDEIE